MSYTTQEQRNGRTIDYASIVPRKRARANAFIAATVAGVSGLFGGYCIWNKPLSQERVEPTQRLERPYFPAQREQVPSLTSKTVIPQESDQDMLRKTAYEVQAYEVRASSRIIEDALRYNQLEEMVRTWGEIQVKVIILGRQIGKGKAYQEQWKDLRHEVTLGKIGVKEFLEDRRDIVFPNDWVLQAYQNELPAEAPTERKNFPPWIRQILEEDASKK